MCIIFLFFTAVQIAFPYNRIKPSQYSDQPTPSKDWRLKIVITGFNTTTNKNRYRVDYLNVDENGGGYAILQAEKDLPNPNTTETIVDGSGNDVYKFQFNDDIGFNIGDYWIVNIHSKSGVFSGSNPSFGNQTLSGLTTSFLTYQWPQQSLTPRYASHYSIPQGDQFNINQSTGNEYTSATQPNYPVTQDRPIAAGARIKININDNSKLDLTTTQNIDKDILSENEFISPRDYANIEEWFWESGAFRIFKHKGHVVDVAANNTPTQTITGNVFNDEVDFGPSRVFLGEDLEEKMFRLQGVMKLIEYLKLMVFLIHKHLGV